MTVCVNQVTGHDAYHCYAENNYSYFGSSSDKTLGEGARGCCTLTCHGAWLRYRLGVCDGLCGCGSTPGSRTSLVGRDVIYIASALTGFWIAHTKDKGRCLTSILDLLTICKNSCIGYIVN